MTHELLELAKWLEQERVSHVAMESTGVYWRPVFNLLEGRAFELLVVNARHVKAVPGRKTDVKDAEWLAELLRYGLMRASFIPDRAQRELRDLVRYRRTLIQEKARLITRVQKLLESANVKLSDVASNVMGMSGRAMLKELAAGNTDADQIAQLALSNLRSKRDRLAQALAGSVGPHQQSCSASLKGAVRQLRIARAENLVGSVVLAQLLLGSRTRVDLGQDAATLFFQEVPGALFGLPESDCCVDDEIHIQVRSLRLQSCVRRTTTFFSGWACLTSS